MDRNTFNHYLDEFELFFPATAEKAIDWWPSGRYEITIKLNDGTRVIYDGIDRAMRNISRPMEETISEEEWKQNFSRQFRKRARMFNFSNEYISETTGISKTSISKYMNGHAIPNAYNLMKIAEVMQCSEAELTEFE